MHLRFKIQRSNTGKVLRPVTKRLSVKWVFRVTRQAGSKKIKALSVASRGKLIIHALLYDTLHHLGKICIRYE